MLALDHGARRAVIRRNEIGNADVLVALGVTGADRATAEAQLAMVRSGGALQ